jgi:hypothetical protein
MGRLKRLRSRFACDATLAAVCIISLAAIGCGRWDLGGVRGQVVSSGRPRGFDRTESMRLTFSTEINSVPRAYLALVKSDGTFVADMNNDSGRGIPFGTYEVAIDPTSFQINEASSPGNSAGSPAANDNSPPPGSRSAAVKRLLAARCTLKVAAGKTSKVVVDVDNGTISEATAR